MNMKFQPEPQRDQAGGKVREISARQGDADGSTACNQAAPTAMTLMTPNRLMRLPVKKLGAEHADDVPLDDGRRIELKSKPQNVHREWASRSSACSSRRTQGVAGEDRDDNRPAVRHDLR